jgi:hypothetical protein
MERVEQIARFQAPKYFSAYMDMHLRAIGRDDLIDGEQRLTAKSLRSLRDKAKPYSCRRTARRTLSHRIYIMRDYGTDRDRS